MAKCYNHPMSLSDKSPRILHADPEHGGLSLVVIVVLLLGLLFGFLLLQFLLGTLPAGNILREFSMVLSCSGALALGIGIAWAAEKQLKRIWRSGSMLLLGDTQFAYHFGKHEQVQIEEYSEEMIFDLSKFLNMTHWYFELRGYPRAGRERRVSKKWLCLSCQIQQDDARLIVFGYYPPEKAAVWIDDRDLSEPFHPISLARLYAEAGKKGLGTGTRPTISSSMLTGSDGRYWLAEKNRWQIGVELTPKDFTMFMEYIEQNT